MKSPRLTFGLANLSDPNLETKSFSILAAMTGNANFPTPVPDLTVVGTAVTDFSVALAAASNRDKVLVAVKNAKRGTMLDVLRSLSAYVSFTANGDKAMLVSSGFDLAKDSGSPLPLQQPKNFRVISGMNPGEATTSVNGGAGTKSYIHQFAADPLTEASIWQSEYVTVRTHTFEGLEVAKKLWFRVAAVGSFGQIAYTDPISLIIQ